MAHGYFDFVSRHSLTMQFPDSAGKFAFKLEIVEELRGFRVVIMSDFDFERRNVLKCVAVPGSERPVFAVAHTFGVVEFLCFEFSIPFILNLSANLTAGCDN